MIDSAAACARGRAWPSRSRTQGVKRAGGTRAPDPSQPDSPENDIPPPPGSPAERFEQECQVNPQACQ